MSTELWQQAKQALAKVMELDSQERSDFLAQLQSESPDLYSEVASLLESQAAAEDAGFLEPDDTVDIHRTETFDPNQTQERISVSDLDAGPLPISKARDLVGDEYELGKKIGQGGMGVVYRAYHRSLRRTVALKIITAGGLRDEIDIARFHLEAEAAARLDHPGIIPVYDVGEHNGNHFYAMAYVEGPSLAEFVGDKKQKLAPRRVAELMEQVCHAVQYAHDRAVIHRDLKPANIMLEHGEVPRLADFGLAKNMHEDEGLTMTGQVMGTPSYMAPEQATGKIDQITNRTDVYSLGATLYALLAGRPPFSGGTMLETIRQVVRTDPEPLTKIVRTVPRDLQTICEKCLAKRSEDRYASAADVAADLRRHLDGFPISARPLAPWARAMRWCQRNPVEAALLTITATALIVGTIVSLRFGLEANRQAIAARNALDEANANAQRLRQSIKESFVFASEDVLAEEPGMQAARAVLLETAQRYYAELVEQTPHDAKSQVELADAQFMLGKVQMALGQDQQAQTTLKSALDMQTQLAADAPGDAEILAALAKSHNQLATLAQKNWQTITQSRDVAKLSDEQKAEADEQLATWQEHSTEVIRLRRQVVDLTPADLESRRLLASAIMNEGNIWGIRGYDQSDLAEQDRAREKLLEAQQIRQGTLQEFPDEVLMRRDLARGFFNMANTELRAADQEPDDAQYERRLRLAIDDLTAGIEAYEALPRTELVLETQLNLARCYRSRADARYRLVQFLGEASEPVSHDEVVRDYQQAEKQLKLLTDRNPNVFRYRIEFAETQYNICAFLYFQQQLDRGKEQLTACRQTLLQALRIDPQNADAADQLVRFTGSIAEFLMEKDPQDYPRAEQVLQDSLDELLALEQEAEEYAQLRPVIEILKEKLSDVQKLRKQAETPESEA